MATSALTNCDIEKAINQLKQSLVSSDRALTGKACQVLYNAGDEAVKPLLKELERIDFENVAHPIAIPAICGLATILHDLNETESRALITLALSKPCHPSIQSAFRTILRFSKTNYRQSFFNGIVIFEEKTIDPRYDASKHVQIWLKNLPEEDLEGIPFLYIVEDQSSFDYLGQYLPHFGTITLIWNTFFHPQNPIQWLARIGFEGTLYHEVGHHRNKHTEGGQVPEQEKEANTYARHYSTRAHPHIARVVWAVKRGLRMFKRKRLDA
ncbi:MAG: hypothetical protein ABJN26_07970 [Stappiaceae bacterium]